MKTQIVALVTVGLLGLCAALVGCNAFAAALVEGPKVELTSGTNAVVRWSTDVPTGGRARRLQAVAGGGLRAAGGHRLHRQMSRAVHRRRRDQARSVDLSVCSRSLRHRATCASLAPLAAPASIVAYLR